MASGTRKAKFCPIMTEETTHKCDSPQTKAFRLQTITAMPEYGEKSLEELRLEDYYQNISGTRNARYSASTTEETTNINGVQRSKVYYVHNITEMSEYQNKSLEELRLQDYKQNNKQH